MSKIPVFIRVPLFQYPNFGEIKEGKIIRIGKPFHYIDMEEKKEELPSQNLEIDTGWEDYLQSLFEAKTLSFDLVWFLQEFVRELDFGSPIAAEFVDDTYVQLVWDIPTQYFKVDVYVTGHFEWFYQNRETEHYLGGEERWQQGTPADVVHGILSTLDKDNGSEELD